MVEQQGAMMPLFGSVAAHMLGSVLLFDANAILNKEVVVFIKFLTKYLSAKIRWKITMVSDMASLTFSVKSNILKIILLIT